MTPFGDSVMTNAYFTHDIWRWHVTTATRTPSVDHFRVGLLFAVGSALAFGMSGPLAKSLMEAGWSPTAAVTARLAGGAVALAIFATIVRPGWVREAVQHRKVVVAYGLIPIAGAQLCYFNAVSHLSVAVALLIEYTAPVLVVGYLWATTRRRPSNLTMVGVVLAIAGIMLVLGIFQNGGLSGAHISLVGVGWAVAAAICAACYFMMSDEASADSSKEGSLNSITLAAGGLIVGAVAVGVLGASGVMPLIFTANDTVVAGKTMSWIVPVIALALIPTAIAYTLGILGIARLRPRFASLVGLAEVLFAVIAAWALLGEAISVTQAVGGAVVLVGLALARQGDRTEIVAQATWPEIPHEERPPGQTVGRG